MTDMTPFLHLDAGIIHDSPNWHGQPGESKLVRCPLCRGSNIAHIGKPPGEPGTTFNRCGITELSGTAGHGAKTKQPLSWFVPVRRTVRKPCNFPLTRLDGSLIIPLDFELFKEFTRYDFSVQALAELVIQHQQVDSFYPLEDNMPLKFGDRGRIP